LDKYILCDACNSPYNLNKDECPVCGYKRDKKQIKKEARAVLKKKADIMLSSATVKFIAWLLKYYRLLYIFIIVSASVLFIVSFVLMVLAGDVSVIKRISFIFSNAFKAVVSSITVIVWPSLSAAFNRFWIRCMVIFPVLWIAFSGLFTNMWKHIAETKNIFLNSIDKFIELIRG
jgi:ribosomal protein L37E